MNASLQTTQSSLEHDPRRNSYSGGEISTESSAFVNAPIPRPGVHVQRVLQAQRMYGNQAVQRAIKQHSGHDQASGHSCGCMLCRVGKGSGVQRAMSTVQRCGGDPTCTDCAGKDEHDHEPNVSQPIQRMAVAQRKAIVRREGETDEAQPPTGMNDPAQQDQEPQVIPFFIEGSSGPFEVQDHGNCSNINLQGITRATYSPTFGSGGAFAQRAADVVATGTINATFSVSTNVTLPSVPAGLPECETNLIQNGIDTTLRNHENQHVTAFNTYRGTSALSYTETLAGRNISEGAPALQSTLDPLLQARFDAVEVPRRAASDAASAALDPFNFTVDCSSCPDPVPTPAPDAGAGSPPSS